MHRGSDQGWLWRCAALVAALGAPACTAPGVLDGKDCDPAGRCLEGYLCDPSAWSCLAHAGRLLAEAALAAGKVEIDADREEWDGVQRLPLTKLGWGTAPESAADFACAFGALWDRRGLYLLVECQDEAHPAPDSGADLHEDDCVEVFLDLDPSTRQSAYARDSNQLLVTAAAELQEYPAHPWGWSGSAAHRAEGGAWWLELRLDWPDDLPPPEAGALLGFDLAADDDDGEGGDALRERQLFFNDASGQAWQDASLFGWLRLLPEGTDPHPDACGDGRCAGLESAASCPADCR
ncbi:MAG TPA: sugar-binding protein [Myxococcota bacterium]|nr:sugar-binding protein [Myxococcota bacterium]